MIALLQRHVFPHFAFSAPLRSTTMSRQIKQITHSHPLHIIADWFWRSRQDNMPFFKSSLRGDLRLSKRTEAHHPNGVRDYERYSQETWFHKESPSRKK